MHGRKAQMHKRTDDGYRGTIWTNGEWCNQFENQHPKSSAWTWLCQKISSACICASSSFSSKVLMLYMEKMASYHVPVQEKRPHLREDWYRYTYDTHLHTYTQKGKCNTFFVQLDKRILVKLDKSLGIHWKGGPFQAESVSSTMWPVCPVEICHHFRVASRHSSGASHCAIRTSTVATLLRLAVTVDWEDIDLFQDSQHDNEMQQDTQQENEFAYFLPADQSSEVTFVRAISVCVFFAEATAEIHSAGVDVDQHPLEVTSMGRLAQRKMFHKGPQMVRWLDLTKWILMRFGQVDKLDRFFFCVATCSQCMPCFP